VRTTIDRIVGEFTVVVDVGQMTEYSRQPVLDAASARDEFGYLTNNDGLTRRQAITALSKRHAIPAKRIYELLEASKRQSGE